MKVWPLPDSFNNSLPKKNSKGAFWEDRGDRFNAGVDIYAPDKSPLYAVENGKVIDIDIFSNSNNSYLNETKYLIIKSPEKVNYKYCEVDDILVEIGDEIAAGQYIANIKQIINPDCIDNNTPFFVKELVYEDLLSKLHLEMYKSPFTEIRPYELGNYLGEEKPNSIIDPNIYFMGIKNVSKAQ